MLEVYLQDEEKMMLALFFEDWVTELTIGREMLL
jgi:hypothetical protein